MNASQVVLCAGLVSVISMTGCSSTTMLESRKAAGASVDLDRLNKVLVVAKTNDESVRRVAEDRMATYHKSFRVSYSVFSQKEIMGDETKYKESLKRAGYDGVLTIRFLGKGKETRYVQGTYIPGTYQSGPFGRPVSYNPGYYLPGYYREDIKNWIQVDVFSLIRNQLLWSGVTESTNLSGVDKTVTEVLDEVRRHMIRDKFIGGG